MEHVLIFLSKLHTKIKTKSREGGTTTVSLTTAFLFIFFLSPRISIDGGVTTATIVFFLVSITIFLLCDHGLER